MSKINDKAKKTVTTINSDGNGSAYVIPILNISPQPLLSILSAYRENQY